MEKGRLLETGISAIAISGDYAYASVNTGIGKYRIEAVDISNPAQPQVAGSVDLESLSGITLDVQGNFLLARRGNTLNIIDISSPAELKTLKSYSLDDLAGFPDIPGYQDQPALRTGDGVINADRLYLSATGPAETGILIIDISDPLDLKKVNYQKLLEGRTFAGVHF